MKKIERPNWNHLGLGMSNLQVGINGLNCWFNENLKGKFVVGADDLLRVYSEFNGKENPLEFSTHSASFDTHQAYIIESSIESIKKQETSLDVLRELSNIDVETYSVGDLIRQTEKFKERAKAALEREEKEGES